MLKTVHNITGCLKNKYIIQDNKTFKIIIIQNNPNYNLKS